ncbi:MAG: sigma-70 family RNA polymerase sigma factor [Bacteroidales bacterium]|nr:sigma-70 family RNA polymerase sigma factor [Bacteroidales bacterium]
MNKILNSDKSRNIKIFREYFDKYFDNIRGYLYYKSSDIELSEDISQEVFLKLWENIDKIKSETVKSYLYTIAGNLFKNHYNRKKVEFKFTSSLTESLVESPEFLLEFKEFDRILQSALEKIPEKSRIVFLMSRIDKLTYKEIAERLKLSVKAVEKRMKKALEILHEIIDFKV